MKIKILIVLWIVGSLTACNLFFGTPSTNNAPSTFDDSLLAYFPFDKNADDIGPQAFNGKIVGATPVAGIKNNAYYFDGIDDYIEIENTGDHFNFTYQDSFSISFWIKPDLAQKDVDVHENDILTKWVTNDLDTAHLGFSYPFCFRYLNRKKRRGTGKFYVANYGGNTSDCGQSVKAVSSTSLSHNSFDHIVFVQTEKSMKLFLNGKQQAAVATRYVCPNFGNANLRIGKRGGLKYQNHFAGIIDELMIFDKALDANEIKALYKIK